MRPQLKFWILAASLGGLSSSAFVFPGIAYATIPTYGNGDIGKSASNSGNMLADTNNGVCLNAAESSSSSSPATTTTTTTSIPKSDMTIPTKGCIVTIDCALRPEGDFIPEPLFDGIVLEDYDPMHRLSFVLGGGNYLPGLHDLLSEMKVGETRENISMDAGWGGWNPDLEATLSFESIEGSGITKDQIKMGVELYLSNGTPAVVTKVTNDDFTIDANPPLAGASYIATVKLLSAEIGPTNLEFEPTSTDASKYQVATFALGCFWGGELAYMRVPGVVGTKVGYTQGKKIDPTYEEVCSGSTGHTEAIMVTFDPTVVSYERLVHLAMDRLAEYKYLPNQVGNDIGTQYRHGVYYHNNEQKEIAERIIASFGEDCVTECQPAKIFYNAEDYHQQYLLKGGQTARKGDETAIRCYG